MPAGSRIRVVLVDDHHMFREALRDLLATVENIEIVGEAQDAHTAFALVEREKPDVAVIDLALPGLDGIAAAQEIRHRSSTTRTLILSGSSRAENASRALAAGVDGFAIKAQWSEELLVAIWAVARGERYVAPQLESVAAAGSPPIDDALERLSRREREVFDLIVQGFSNQRIAQHLGLSPKTVETHRAHINEKLGVHSSVEIIRFAVARGLLGAGST